MKNDPKISKKVTYQLNYIYQAQNYDRLYEAYFGTA